jgi:hypothetical protein
MNTHKEGQPMKVTKNNNRQTQHGLIEMPARNFTPLRSSKAGVRGAHKQNSPAEERPKVSVDGALYDEDGNQLTNHDLGFETLRIRNLSVDTSPRALVQLFKQQQFYVADLQINLIFADDLTGMEAFLTLRAEEAVDAQVWADRRSWRGRKLDVAVLREGKWWSLNIPFWVREGDAD